MDVSCTVQSIHLISSCSIQFITKDYTSHMERSERLVESVYAEANESTLENRRIHFDVEYATKFKSYPSNPVYDCVYNPLYEHVCDKQHNTLQPSGIRVKSHFDNSDIINA